MDELNKNNLLSPKEAADILGVKEETLTMWEETHRYNLPSVKIGWQTLYRFGDILDLADKIKATQSLKAANDNNHLVSVR